MAHFTRVRAPGDWTDELPPSDMEELDKRQHGAITKRGGCWAPSSVITIGGAQGIEVTGPCRLDKVTGLTLASGVSLGYASRSIVREQDLLSATVGLGWKVGSLAALSRIADTSSPVLQQDDTSPGTSVPRTWVPLSLPVGSVLTRIDVRFFASLAHEDADILPESMPRIAFVHNAHDDAGAYFGAPVFDSSVNAAAYRALHSVVQTLSHTVLDSELHWVAIDGEYGTNSDIGLCVASVRTTCTLTVDDEFQL